MSLASQNATSSSAALLSASTINENGDALMTVSGETVLAHQIAALRSAGIAKFLIEVDSVSGALLAMADRITQAGCSVDFIRSAQDLQSRIGNSNRLIVQAEGIYLAPDLLEELLGGIGDVIVTIDGRSENEAYERMDLNTRWTGFAVLPPSIASNIGALPDGWSLSSSLLRQAMQNGVTQRPLKQNNVQIGDLRRVVNGADADKLAKDILARRASREPGFIEARIFGPAAANLAPTLWRTTSGAALSNGSVVVLGVSSVGLAALGLFAAAISVSIAAIFANSVRSTLQGVNNDRGPSRWSEPSMWVLLATALISACGDDAQVASEGLFAGSVVAGLATLSRQLRLPGWAKKTLQSPALLAFTLLLLTPVTGLTNAVKWVAILQLVLLVAAKWNHKPRL